MKGRRRKTTTTATTNMNKCITKKSNYAPISVAQTPNTHHKRMQTNVSASHLNTKSVSVFGENSEKEAKVGRNLF